MQQMDGFLNTGSTISMPERWRASFLNETNGARRRLLSKDPLYPRVVYLVSTDVVGDTTSYSLSSHRISYGTIIDPIRQLN